jgi:DNA-binding NarL/FixJ family response regulator
MGSIDLEPLRVVIAHPLPLVRRALSLRVAEEDGVDVVGECWSPRNAVELVDLTHADISIVGLGHDWPPWLDACSEIAALGSKVLLVSDDLSPTVLALATRAGAEGFVRMSTAGLTTVVAALRTVARNEAWVPRSLVGPLLRALVANRREDDAATAKFSRLSSRERDALRLLVKGLDHQQIASELVLSPHTARTHIQHVLEKLEVHSRLEAVTMALGHNLIERFG